MCDAVGPAPVTFINAMYSRGDHFGLGPRRARWSSVMLTVPARSAVYVPTQPRNCVDLATTVPFASVQSMSTVRFVV